MGPLPQVSGGLQQHQPPPSVQKSFASADLFCRVIQQVLSTGLLPTFTQRVNIVMCRLDCRFAAPQAAHRASHEREQLVETPLVIVLNGWAHHLRETCRISARVQTSSG